MISADRWPLAAAASMRALDAHTIETLGVSGELLMETAGHSCVEAVLELLASHRGGDVVVVCGGGNNGGDGFVIARHLQGLGLPVRVALLADPGSLRGDAARNYQRCRQLSVPIETGGLVCPARGVIVDAMFGTGLARAVEGRAAAAIEAINSARSPDVSVLAVDLPSGIDSDTGGVLGCAVRADTTVTLSLPKLGIALEPGRSHAGRVRVARIGIADEAPGVALAAELFTPRGAGRALPERPPDGHKGRFGHVLIAAGSEGKTGAAALAAVAAGRAGAGLVTLACPVSLSDVLEAKCTEAMTAALPETEGRALGVGAEEGILELAAERDVLAIGPGIGRADDTIALVHSLAKRALLPLVIDADGLFAFSQDPGVLKGREAPTILTPHPGEAARLLGGSAAEVNTDRVGVARELAALTGAVVILKGAATVTAEPSGRVVVNPTGGPALATGGTGDVLTGVVAALLAQRCSPFEAAAAAAYLHGEAADRCARRIGAAGLLAGDVAAELPAAAAGLRRAADATASAGSDEDIASRSRSQAPNFADSQRRVAAGLLLDFPGS